MDLSRLVPITVDLAVPAIEGAADQGGAAARDGALGDR
jgi:hypothetical protein